MDRARQLWQYEGNEEAISRWLSKWLGFEASPRDQLTWAWLHGEAEEGSAWTRNQELSEWIEASQKNSHAWEGVKTAFADSAEARSALARNVVVVGTRCCRRDAPTTEETEGPG